MKIQLIRLFRNVYYLFASKSGGYWCSNNFKDCAFVESRELDIEKYTSSVFIEEGTKVIEVK